MLVEKEITDDQATNGKKEEKKDKDTDESKIEDAD